MSSIEIASQLAALQRQRRTVTRVVVWTTAAVTVMSLLAVAATAAAAPAPVAKETGLVVSHGGRIYVEGKPVTTGDQPVWSPDGRRIAFQRSGRIFVADADGRNQRRLTRGAHERDWPASSPAWSPDGKAIAFSDPRDVFTVPVQGGKPVNLTKSRASWQGNVAPAYSPDGMTIAFSRSTDAFNSDIFLMSKAGKNLRRLTRTQGTHDSLGEETWPAWSPDGRTIAFVSNRDGHFEIYSIGRDGRNERRITRTLRPRYEEESPRFSRDGKRLLYVHDGRVATIKVDGSGVRELGLGTAADWK